MPGIITKHPVLGLHVVQVKKSAVPTKQIKPLVRAAEKPLGFAISAQTAPARGTGTVGAVGRSAGPGGTVLPGGQPIVGRGVIRPGVGGGAQGSPFWNRVWYEKFRDQGVGHGSGRQTP